MSNALSFVFFFQDHEVYYNAKIGNGCIIICVIFCVYILECSDGTLYTGVTSNIEQRLRQHSEGRYETCYTFTRRPIKLLYKEEFQYILDAIAREKQIKGWSRSKKLALINQNFSVLRLLSKPKKQK